MNTTNQIKTVAIAVMVAISISILSGFSTVTSVQAELNTSDFRYSIDITDIIPYYTYQGISKVLTNGHESLEDQDVIRLVIQDTNYYAVYNNSYDNNFVFAGIYENGA